MCLMSSGAEGWERKLLPARVFDRHMWDDLLHEIHGELDVLDFYVVEVEVILHALLVEDPGIFVWCLVPPVLFVWVSIS